jgi:hypothetical protein
MGCLRAAWYSARASSLLATADVDRFIAGDSGTFTSDGHALTAFMVGLLLHHDGHPILALAGDVDVGGAGVFQQQPHEFTASGNARLSSLSITAATTAHTSDSAAQWPRVVAA